MALVRERSQGHNEGEGTVGLKIGVQCAIDKRHWLEVPDVDTIMAFFAERAESNQQGPDRHEARAGPRDSSRVNLSSAAGKYKIHS